MRLFAALPLPPSVESRLSALRLRLATPRDGLRWTTPEQWHITLRFFGDLEAAHLLPLIAEVETFRHPQPLLRMASLGLFPSKGILYAAIEPSDELTAFHTAFAAHVAPWLAPASSLPFHPHITLARSKGRAGSKALQQMAKSALPPFGTVLQWLAGPVHLYESVLGPQGAAYDTLATQHATDPLLP